jgi:hypothetical protein
MEIYFKAPGVVEYLNIYTDLRTVAALNLLRLELCFSAPGSF